MAIIHQGVQTPIKPDVYDVLMGEFDAAETPLFNRLKRGPDSPNATLFDWPFDKPDTPVTTGSTEATAFSSRTPTTHGGRALMYGRMHHFVDPFHVGEVAEGNKVYGTSSDSQFAYEMRRSLRLAMTSAESVIVGTQENQAGTSSTAFRTRGLQTYIKDTANIAAQTDATTVIPADFRPAAAQHVSLSVTASDYDLTEDNITDPFDAVYSSLKSKMDLDVFCSAQFMKKVALFGRLQANVTNFTAVRRFNAAAEDMKVTAVVETYVGPTGTARFELHPYVAGVGAATAEALGLSLRYIQLRVRRAPMSEELKSEGSGRRGQTLWTMGLQCTPKYQAQWVASA